jgi:putative transposase
MKNPFRYFNSSPEIIRLAVMMYDRYPLSVRQVEDLLFERGIGICHETVRFWWSRFGLMFAAEIRKRRVHHGWYSNWRWHLDEVFVKINGETHYLWRAVDRRQSGRDDRTLEKSVRNVPFSVSSNLSQFQ